MRLQMLAGALALAGPSSAFSDSSPLILLSTSAFADTPGTASIQTSSQAVKNAKEILSTCPTDRYLIATQPGVLAADLRGSAGCSMPHLCQVAENSQIKGKLVIPEVVGEISSSELVSYIESACSAQGKQVTVTELTLPSTSRDDRAGSLAENDLVLKESFDTVTADSSYTIIFQSTPAEPNYEASFMDINFDLRRNVENTLLRRQNGTDRNLPLFEKYQFFTPGIFMGIVVALILLSILGVGLRALSSLEVSYGAFDKEMGPAAQKKQQ